jgi:hypothetical protein
MTDASGNRLSTSVFTVTGAGNSVTGDAYTNLLPGVPDAAYGGYGYRTSNTLTVGTTNDAVVTWEMDFRNTPYKGIRTESDTYYRMFFQARIASEPAYYTSIEAWYLPSDIVAGSGVGTWTQIPGRWFGLTWLSDMFNVAVYPIKALRFVLNVAKGASTRTVYLAEFGLLGRNTTFGTGLYPNRWQDAYFAKAVIRPRISFRLELARLAKPLRDRDRRADAPAHFGKHGTPDDHPDGGPEFRWRQTVDVYNRGRARADFDDLRQRIRFADRVAAHGHDELDGLDEFSDFVRGRHPLRTSFGRGFLVWFVHALDGERQ